MFTKEEALPRLCAVLRIILAWFMLWPFLDKLFGLGFQTPEGAGMVDGGSPSESVIYVADGILKDFWFSLGGNAFIDGLMMFALLAIGTCLLLGIASRVACISFTAFLLVMYSLVIPPVDNPILDYHITWIMATWIVFCAGGFEKYSLADKWRNLPIIRDYVWLQ